jgi:hypothetical protein
MHYETRILKQAWVVRERGAGHEAKIIVKIERP